MPFSPFQRQAIQTAVLPKVSTIVWYIPSLNLSTAHKLQAVWWILLYLI
jgi:hypothetical protein